MGKTGVLPSAFLQRFEPMTHGFDFQKQPNKIRPRSNLIFIGSADSYNSRTDEIEDLLWFGKEATTFIFDATLNNVPQVVSMYHK